MSSVGHFPTVAAALQTSPEEEPEQSELSEAPAAPTAVPEPESLSQERRLAEQAPTANDIDPAVRARMDACLDDTSRSDADLRLMRGNLLNVIDGMLAPLSVLGALGESFGRTRGGDAVARRTGTAHRNGSDREPEGAQAHAWRTPGAR